MKQVTVIRKITCLLIGSYILCCLHAGCITEAALLPIDLGSILSCLTGSCSASTTIVTTTTAKSTAMTSKPKAVSTTQTKGFTTENKKVTTAMANPDTTSRPKAVVVVQTTLADPITTLRVQKTTEQGCTVAVMTSADRNCSGENLTNTVVYEGVKMITFPKPSNGQNSYWQVTPASATFAVARNITNCGDGTVKPEFNGAYAVNGSSLTISIATTAPQGSMNYSTAGLFTFKHLNPKCTTAANLIVIKTGPVCACNTTSPNNVTLSCSVTYAQSYIQPCNPVFKWMNASGYQVKQEKPIPMQIDAYTRRSRSQLPIASNDATKYACELTWSAPPKSPYAYIAPTAPVFKSSCLVSLV